MKEALFIFVLSIAGAVALAYLVVVVAAALRRTRLDGCGLLVAGVAAVLAVWTLLYLAGQIGGVAIPSPW